MSSSSWESLKSGFMQIRTDCAIDPRLKPAGRLKAIWNAFVEPRWAFEYWGGEDGMGATERFKWHAQKAAAMLRYAGSGEDAVWFWLDRISRDAPKAYVGLDHPQMKEIFDVCGLSAEYCTKCEAEEIMQRLAHIETGRSKPIDAVQGDNVRPLGDNPFPQDHPAYEAFEEANWKAKTAISRLKVELLRTNYDTKAELIQSLLTFRKRWFTAVAFEATLIVGNEETAQWYEHWIDDHANWLLEDTLSQARRKDPKADPAAPPFLSSDDIERIESELKLELMRMVEHYKGVAAARVVEVIGLRNAAQTARATESEGAASGVNPAHANQEGPAASRPFQEIEAEATSHLPGLPPKFQNAFEAAKANAELEQAKLARSSPHLAIYEIDRLKLIQDVFFAYCTQARAACRAGNITVAQARQAGEAALHSISDLYFVRDHGTRSNDAKLTFRGHFTQGVTNDPQWHRHLLELAELAEDSAKEPTQTASQRSGCLSFRLNDWQDLEIRFLSDERIHLNVGECSETRNYAEFGFEDRRTKKPNLAWVTLRALAQKEGIIKQAVNGQDWRSVEKRIQEIRRLFRKHFELDADPIPFVDGLGYKASFKINCAPFFES
jgi:hypothetical protein